ncbi:MAG: hypothetical protein ACP5OG_00965 [Candidatus Nanoarchaeia archaeon]
MIKKSSFFLIFLILILSVFVFSPIISAYQEKMTIKSCIFSLNDENFGDWNAQEQKGVFIKITNKNLDLGTKENANWEMISYTGQNNYFNEYPDENQGISNIPILPVEESRENIIYTQCELKIGDYRIFPTSEFNFLYGKSSYGLRATNDFKLTKDLILAESASPNTLNYNYNQIKKMYGDVQSKFSYHNQSTYLAADEVYYFNNGIEEGSTNQDLTSKGFYKNKDAVVKTKMDIKNMPSGLFTSVFLLKESGRADLINFTGTEHYFYINSNINDIRDYLLPTYSLTAGNNIVNCNLLKFEIISSLNPASVGKKSCKFYCNTDNNKKDNDGDCLSISPGDTISITQKIQNDFNVDLNEATIINEFTTGNERLSIGVLGTDVKVLSQEFSKDITLPPLGTESVSFEITLPEKDSENIPYQYHRLRVWRSMTNEKNQEKANTDIPIIGSDSNAYLSFGRIDSRVVLKPKDQSYEPYLDTKVLLYEDNYAKNIPINPQDYSFLVKILDNTTEAKDVHIINEYSRSLENEVNDLNSPLSFNFRIPLGEEYINTIVSGIKPRVYIYAISNLEPFKDKIISRNQIPSTFEAGDLLYPEGKKLEFWIDSRLNTEKVILFNPSFFETQITLKITDSPDNFVQSFDNINFNQNPQVTLTLGPLTSKKVPFSVKSIHSTADWPKSEITEHLKISAAAQIKTGPSIDQTKSITSGPVEYDLIVHENNVKAPSWINLYATEIDPDKIELKDTTSSKQESIKLKWMVTGSEQGFKDNKNQEYYVKASLIDKSNGGVLKTQESKFTITENKEELIELPYEFSYKNYQLKIEIDETKKITETDSSSQDAESDNIKTFDLKILACNYNINEKKLYILDSSKTTPVLDTNCFCTCPPGSGLVCSSGECLSPLPGIDYCKDYGSKDNCEKDPNKVANKLEYLRSEPGFCSGKIIASTDNGQGEKCNVTANCKCIWDNTQDKCISGYSTLTKCSNSDTIIPSTFACLLDYNFKDNCETDPDNGILITWSESLAGSTTSSTLCTKSGTTQVPCPDNIPRLSFFNSFNFIISIMFIAIFYFFVSTRKRK